MYSGGGGARAEAESANDARVHVQWGRRREGRGRRGEPKVQLSAAVGTTLTRCRSHARTQQNQTVQSQEGQCWIAT